MHITPRTGRLFRGDSRRVVFVQQPIREFAMAHRHQFDLVIVCDVMHHVRPTMHHELLMQAAQTICDGGRFVLKEWERRNNVAHLLGYLSDRCLTGDNVHYETAQYFAGLIRRVFGSDSIQREQRIPPWPNNIAFMSAWQANAQSP